jgi:SAM-dependent methyltransferase
LVPALVRGRANAGWCPICERRTVFVEDGPWLRDQYRCRRCHSVPRMRALLTVLGEVAPDWRSLRVFECSPAGASSDKLGAECAGYVRAFWRPDLPPGAIADDGERNENLEALSFPDSTFDVVVTQDVLEHVLRPERAFAEIARVLRPGGVHVFTVPVYPREATVVRAEADADGGVRHLREPDFHYDPVDPSGSLVVREWGRDIVGFIDRVGGVSTEMVTRRDRRRGLDGEFLEVLVSRRTSV